MKSQRIRKLVLFCCMICAAVAAVWLFTRPSLKEKDTLVITMPENDLIRNLDLNAYTLWLEEQSGVNLEFNLIPETYGADYLEQVFTSGHVKTDIVFAFHDEPDNYFTQESVARLGKMGYLLPLNPFITENTYMEKVFRSFPDYDLREYMTADDGNLYFFPNMDATAKARFGQTLWLNRSWMQELSIPYPQTTEELYNLLRAYAESDANANGIKDEIPLAGSGVVDYLLSSFIYNDPANMRLFVQSGQVQFAPVTPQWRQGVEYLQTLYSEGLISSAFLNLSDRSFVELASSPGDYLGGFTAASITDVLLPTCGDRAIHFASISPVKGPDGKAYSTIQIPTPRVGAVISAQCNHPEKAFALLDLMLSEEAFLIAKYGEKDVDWCIAAATDLDSYGEKAAIKVLNPLDGRPQNKNFSGMGAFYAYSKYADHVTWSGFDPEYLNARAYLTQLQYAPKEPLGLLPLADPGWQEVERYTKEMLTAFITGKKDVTDDTVWQDYLQGYENRELARLLIQAQNEYKELQNWKEGNES